MRTHIHIHKYTYRSYCAVTMAGEVSLLDYSIPIFYFVGAHDLIVIGPQVGTQYDFLSDCSYTGHNTSP